MRVTDYDSGNGRNGLRNGYDTLEGEIAAGDCNSGLIHDGIVTLLTVHGIL